MNNSIITFSEAQMLEWDTLLTYIQDFCHTETGRQYCDAIQPLDYDSILIQYAKINALKEILLSGFRPDFSGIQDISKQLEKSAKGSTLTLEEIFKVRLFLAGQHRIIAFFKSINYDTTPLTDLNTIDACQNLFTLLMTSLTENGNLNENTYPALRRIQKEIRDIRGSIQQSLNSLIHSHDCQALLQEKIYTIKNNRYVLPIKAAYKNKLKGTILDISASGSTVFIEPDSIHDLSNKLLYKELEFQREIERILQILSYEIGAHSELLTQNAATLAYIDFCIAAARFAIAYNAHSPSVSQLPFLDCIDAKHPLLSIVLKNAVVPCSISCGKSFNCLILSGVNTGGKTVLLKMLGLFALMVRHGLPITASPDSSVGLFDTVYVDIGDEQSLMQSLSTFSGQVKNIVRIVNEATEKSLILIDEIIVGTDPKQGAAIAQAVLEYLVEKNAVIAVTTHYSSLKEIASYNNHFHNASVAFDINSMQPTFQVMSGIPGASYTIQIAKNLHLPDAVINRSTSLMDAATLSTDVLLSKITEQSHALQQKEQELSHMKEELIALEQQYKSKINELQIIIEKASKEQAASFLQELQDYRNMIVERIKEIQSMSMKEASQLMNDIPQLQQKVSRIIKSSHKPSEDALPCTVHNAVIGQKVFVQPLQKYGIIEDIHAKDNYVKVRLGTLTSRFPVDEVFCIVDNNKMKETKKRHHSIQPNTYDAPITVQTKYNSVDLRGLRVDEALQAMDAQLDAIIRNNISTAVVIHGHGTGSLKKAIREYVKHSSYVRDFRPGKPEEGGDGVTIIHLR